MAWSKLLISGLWTGLLQILVLLQQEDFQECLAQAFPVDERTPRMLREFLGSPQHWGPPLAIPMDVSCCQHLSNNFILLCCEQSSVTSSFPRLFWLFQWIQQSWIVRGCRRQQVEGLCSWFPAPQAAGINNPCVSRPCLLKVVHGKKIRTVPYLYLELNEEKLSQPTGAGVIQRHGLAWRDLQAVFIPNNKKKKQTPSET